jgi:hypothetical protein
MTVQTFNSILKSIFPKLTIEAIRRAFIVYKFSKYTNEAERKYISEKMRQNYYSALQYYTEYNDVVNKEKIKHANERQSSKKYYDKNKHNIAKQKYLYKLNNNIIQNPSIETINDYKIVYDKIKKIWI